MPRQGYSEEKIVYALRQVEAGKKVSEVCREMGVSAEAFYTWRRRYAGLGLSKLRELRQLREENRKLKALVAELSLDKQSEAGGAAAIGTQRPRDVPVERGSAPAG